MKHFGTDGIRKKADEFTNEYLSRIAAATVAAKGFSVVIGRDTRESGFPIETALVDTLVTYGCTVHLLGVAPTPVVSYFAKKLSCDFGIVISASHNPPEYNGIKFFNGNGEKIDDYTEKMLEEYIDNPRKLTKTVKQNPIIYHDPSGYIDFINEELSPTLDGMKIALDCANGATCELAPRLFASLGATVTPFNTLSDGSKINKACGSTNIDFLLAEMKKGYFDVGFAFDGDGDRVIAVKNGKVLDGDKLIYCHARAMKEKGTLTDDTVVASVMSNMGTENALNKLEIQMVRTPVGDKHILREMLSHGYKLGGEESGHVIFSSYARTGDGLLTAVLTALLCSEGGLECDGLVPYPVATESYYADADKMAEYRTCTAFQQYLQTVSIDGRVIVRPSGTEPKIRITVEAPDECTAKRTAREIKENLEKYLG